MAASPDRLNEQTGTWKLLPESGTSGAIVEGQSVHLLNAYGNLAGGFLDTKGAGCEGNAYCVSTSTLWNRDTEGTNSWRFYQQ